MWIGDDTRQDGETYNTSSTLHCPWIMCVTFSRGSNMFETINFKW